MKVFNIEIPQSFLDLAKGHVISQVLGALCSIWVAKLYGAAALGVFSVFLTSVIMCSIINTCRLESILFLDQNEGDKKNNTLGVLRVAVIVSLLFFLIGMVLPSSLVEKYFVNRILLLAVVLTAFFNSIKTLLEHVTLLRSDYKKIKKAKITFTLVRYSVQLLLVLIVASYYSLIIGYFLATTIVLLYLYKSSEIGVNFNRAHFKETVKRYKSLLLYAFPGDVVNTIAINIFPLLLMSNYGKILTGNYFMSYLVLSIPLTFLYAVVAPVFFKKSVLLVKENRIKELYNYTFSIVKRIFLMVSIPMFVLVFIGKEIVVFFLGEDWRNTGEFIEIFAVLFAFRVLYSPISSLEESFHKNNISLLVNVYFVLVLFLTVFLGKNLFSIFELAKIITGLTSLGYIFLTLYFYFLIKKRSI